MINKTILTGVKPTGAPHIGNYIGAIRPALALAATHERSYLFIADYHALNAVRDPEETARGQLPGRGLLAGAGA